MKSFSLFLISVLAKEKPKISLDEIQANTQPITKGIIIDHNYPDDPKSRHKSFKTHAEVIKANK